MFLFSLALFICTWIVILMDISSNTVFNKKFWIMSMFILPAIAPIVYLFRRKYIIYPDSITTD